MVEDGQIAAVGGFPVVQEQRPRETGGRSNNTRGQICAVKRGGETKRGCNAERDGRQRHAGGRVDVLIQHRPTQVEGELGVRVQAQPQGVVAPVVLVAVGREGSARGEQGSGGAFHHIGGGEVIAGLDEVDAPVEAQPVLGLVGGVDAEALLVARADVGEEVVGVQQLRIAIDPPLLRGTQHHAQQEGVLVDLLAVDAPDGAGNGGNRGRQPGAVVGERSPEFREDAGDVGVAVAQLAPGKAVSEVTAEAPARLPVDREGVEVRLLSYDGAEAADLLVGPSGRDACRRHPREGQDVAVAGVEERPQGHRAGREAGGCRQCAAGDGAAEQGVDEFAWLAPVQPAELVRNAPVLADVVGHPQVGIAGNTLRFGRAAVQVRIAAMDELPEIQEVGAGGAVGGAGGDIQVMEVVGLQGQLPGGNVGADIPALEVGTAGTSVQQDPVASRGDPEKAGGVDDKDAGAGARGSATAQGRHQDAGIDQRSRQVAQKIEKVVVDEIEVVLVVLEEDIAADGSARDKLQVDPDLVAVRAPLGIFGDETPDGRFQGGVDPSVGVVAGVAQADADGRLGQQREGEVPHVARRVLQVRAVGVPGQGGRVEGVGAADSAGDAAGIQVQGIGEEVVVEEILVAPVEAHEVVPLVLLDAQAGHALGVAAEAEAAHVEVVEEHALAGPGLHGQFLAQESRTAVQVDESAVHLLVAVGLGDVPAELDGLVHVVIPPDAALVFGLLRPGQQR